MLPAQPRRAAHLALLLLVALLVPAPGRAEGAAWRAEWRKALALYKKKQYDAACPLFASAAQAQPKNGALWGDLGLCELKRGTPESHAASIHASRLAARFGDERVRRSAYFNLGLAGAKETLPDEACVAVSAPPESECSRSAVACTKGWRTSGVVFQTYGTVAFFARTEAEAQRQREALSELDPAPEAIKSGVSLSEGAENSCVSWCDGHAWQGQDSSLIMQQALACEQKQRGPLPGPPDPCLQGGRRCSDLLDCTQAVLSHVSDSPPIAREWGRLRQRCEADCVKGGDSSPPVSCSVVHVDACSGYVGVVCSVPNEKGSGSTLRASELELPEPESTAP